MIIGKGRPATRETQYGVPTSARYTTGETPVCLPAEMRLGGLRETSGNSAPGGVSFDDIVKARFEVDCAHSSEVAEATSRLADLWRQFLGQENCKLVASFFGAFGTMGAGLTVQGERRTVERPHLHVTVDLAVAGDAAELVSRYERIRVKADQLLVGSERQHVMRVLYDRICRVIRIIDQMLAVEKFRANTRLENIEAVFGRTRMEAMVSELPVEDAKQKAARHAMRRVEIDRAEKRIKNALEVARVEAIQAEELCIRAVRRGAMMAYFVGMLAGVVVFSLLGVGVAILLSHVRIIGFNIESFLTVFIAGAVGAIVSVMSRMSAGDTWLEYETARSYLSLLGMFRPLIGAIFGVALYFGIESGVLQFIKPPTDNHAVFFFFAFIAFLAGFSERWASDVLVPIKDRTYEENRGSAPDLGLTSDIKQTMHGKIR
jgi:hypothetical protein